MNNFNFMRFSKRGCIRDNQVTFFTDLVMNLKFLLVVQRLNYTFYMLNNQNNEKLLVLLQTVYVNYAILCICNPSLRLQPSYPTSPMLCVLRLYMMIRFIG